MAILTGYSEMMLVDLVAVSALIFLLLEKLQKGHSRRTPRL
jgi:hypothetical protein